LTFLRENAQPILGAQSLTSLTPKVTVLHPVTRRSDLDRKARHDNITSKQGQAQK
jgi:hypothetical protein